MDISGSTASFVTIRPGQLAGVGRTAGRDLAGVGTAVADARCHGPSLGRGGPMVAEARARAQRGSSPRRRRALAVAAAGQPPAEVGTAAQSPSGRPRRRRPSRGRGRWRAAGTARSRPGRRTTTSSSSATKSSGQSCRVYDAPRSAWWISTSRRRVGTIGRRRPGGSAREPVERRRPSGLVHQRRPRRRTRSSPRAAARGARRRRPRRAPRCRRHAARRTRTSPPAPRHHPVEHAGQGLAVEGHVGDHVGAGPPAAAATVRRGPRTSARRPCG